MIATPPIIGLVGFPTHGKSTAQRFLTHLGVEARDDAEILRARVMEEYDLSYEDVTTQEGKLKIVPGINGELMTVRKLLGDYGQIFGEELHGPNYWVESAIDSLRFDGVRNPVSFGSLRRSQPRAVKEAGGFILEILDPRKPVGPLHYFDEFDRDDVDCVVVNDSCEKDFALRVMLAVKDYLQLAGTETLLSYARRFF